MSSPPSVSIGVIVMPSASRGTKIIERPSCFVEPSCVRQTISTWLASRAYEIHIFDPFSTYSPLSRTARVLSAPTSDPASGSDIAIARQLPLLATPPSSSCFCSSVPNELSAPTTISVTP